MLGFSGRLEQETAKMAARRQARTVGILFFIMMKYRKYFCFFKVWTEVLFILGGKKY
jgi:hypothetical protein